MMWLNMLVAALDGVFIGMAIWRWYAMPQVHKAHLAELAAMRARHLVELANLARIIRMPGGAEAFMAAAHERARQR